MTPPDIVDELRAWADSADADSRPHAWPLEPDVLRAAAAEIERLRAGVRSLALDAEARGYDALAGSLLLWLDMPGQAITFGGSQ